MTCRCTGGARRWWRPSARTAWDMVGSHELRLEERVRQVMGLRFPEDINAALQRRAHDVHVFLHPTTAIRVAALRAVGGFSTARPFAADIQFLLRAHFSLRCRNLDDFLYLRRKRPGSLTTSPGTGHGEPPRMLVGESVAARFRARQSRRALAGRLLADARAPSGAGGDPPRGAVPGAAAPQRCSAGEVVRRGAGLPLDVAADARPLLARSARRRRAPRRRRRAGRRR